MDSDDVLYPNAIEFLYQIIKENDADISIGGWEDFKDDKVCYRCKRYYEIMDRDTTLQRLFEEEKFMSVIWAKMYKKSVISDIRFDKNLVIAEDLDFIYRVIKNSTHNVLDTNTIIYQYRIRITSAMKSKYSLKFEKEIDLTERILEDVKLNFSHLEKYAIRRYQHSNIKCIDKYFKENSNIKGVEHLKQNLKKYPLNLNKKVHLKLILLLYFRPVLKLIYKVTRKI